jgi:hypothetical protein
LFSLVEVVSDTELELPVVKIVVKAVVNVVVNFVVAVIDAAAYFLDRVPRVRALLISIDPEDSIFLLRRVRAADVRPSRPA